MVDCWYWKAILKVIYSLIERVLVGALVDLISYLNYNAGLGHRHLKCTNHQFPGSYNWLFDSSTDGISTHCSPTAGAWTCVYPGRQSFQHICSLANTRTEAYCDQARKCDSSYTKWRVSDQLRSRTTTWLLELAPGSVLSSMSVPMINHTEKLSAHAVCKAIQDHRGRPYTGDYHRSLQPSWCTEQTSRWHCANALSRRWVLQAGSTW